MIVYQVPVSLYVDGVNSITHGAGPREHIWTYAAGSKACTAVEGWDGRGEDCWKKYHSE